MGIVAYHQSATRFQAWRCCPAFFKEKNLAYCASDLPGYTASGGIGLCCPRKLQFSRMRCPARRPALEVMAFAHLGHSSANPPYHNLSRRMVWFVTGFPVRDMSSRHRQLLRTLKTANTTALSVRGCPFLPLNHRSTSDGTIRSEGGNTPGSGPAETSLVRRHCGFGPGTNWR